MLFSMASRRASFPALAILSAAVLAAAMVAFLSMGPCGRNPRKGGCAAARYRMLHCSSQADCALQHKQAVKPLQAKFTFLQCGAG
jgi:hypothetical protein